MPESARAEIKRELEQGNGFHNLLTRPGLVDQLAQAMPPEHRDRFRENIRRWQSLSPDEREHLRTEARQRFERMREEVDRILKDLQLQLAPEQRDRFQARYIEEREKLERRLRESLDRMRQEEMPALLERLRADFATSGTAQPSATP